MKYQNQSPPHPILSRVPFHSISPHPRPISFFLLSNPNLILIFFFTYQLFHVSPNVQSVRIAFFRKIDQQTPVGPAHGFLQYTFTQPLLLLESLLALCLNRWMDVHSMWWENEFLVSLLFPSLFLFPLWFLLSPPCFLNLHSSSEASIKHLSLTFHLFTFFFPFHYSVGSCCPLFPVLVIFLPTIPSPLLLLSFFHPPILLSFRFFKKILAPWRFLKD